MFMTAGLRQGLDCPPFSSTVHYRKETTSTCSTDSRMTGRVVKPTNLHIFEHSPRPRLFCPQTTSEIFRTSEHVELAPFEEFQGSEIERSRCLSWMWRSAHWTLATGSLFSRAHAFEATTHNCPCSIATKLWRLEPNECQKTFLPNIT